MSLAREIGQRLRAVGRPHRAGSVDGYNRSALQVLGATVPDVRAIVREFAKRVDDVLTVANELAHAGTLEERQVAYELLGRRKDVLATLRVRDVEALGRGNDNWKSVDTFSCEVAGPCWRDGRVTDAAVRRWARSKDRWWRRTALVSTVPLNLKSRGGQGDTPRTLAVCELCVADRDDMVVKAMSWALREIREPAAVRRFLNEHEVAPRVRTCRRASARRPPSGWRKT